MVLLGAGTHISKSSGQLIEGSPTRALSIEPRFSHYHFVDMNAARVKLLRDKNDQHDVTVYHGNYNKILLKEVFPQMSL